MTFGNKAYYAYTLYPEGYINTIVILLSKRQ